MNPARATGGDARRTNDAWRKPVYNTSAGSDRAGAAN